MTARVTEPIDLDTIAVGDHVTSRWTHNGTTWTVTHIGPIERRPLQPPRRLLQLRALITASVNARFTLDLVKVVQP